jgi:hypothetical protein
MFQIGTFMKAQWQFILFLVLLSLFQSSAQAKEPDAIDLLDSAEAMKSPDEQACTTIVQSRLGDKFLKAYMGGNTPEAERLWALMLKQLNGVTSIETLGKQVFSRFAFEIPEGASFGSRYDRQNLYKFCLKATEKAVGKNHRFYMDYLAENGRQMEMVKKYSEAEPMRLKEYQLAVKFFGKESARAMYAAFNDAHDKFYLKRYAEAEPMLKNTIEICERHRYKQPLGYALKTYLNILLATNRKEDADKFLARYHLRIRQ